MDGDEVSGCGAGDVGTCSPSSSPSSLRVRFPSSGTGGGLLDINIASCKSCSSGVRIITAPSLRSGRRGCGAVSGGSPRRLGSITESMTWMGRKGEPLKALPDDSQLTRVTRPGFNDESNATDPDMTLTYVRTYYHCNRFVQSSDAESEPTKRGNETKWRHKEIWSCGWPRRSRQSHVRRSSHGSRAISGSAARNVFETLQRFLEFCKTKRLIPWADLHENWAKGQRTSRPSRALRDRQRGEEMCQTCYEKMMTRREYLVVSRDLDDHSICQITIWYLVVSYLYNVYVR
jgi:hypothetical protein